MSVDTSLLTRPVPVHERILDKYTDKQAKPNQTELLPESAVDALTPDVGGEGTDDLGCMGYLRGTRDSAHMIELRKKDGSIMAINYSYIERVEIEPSEGITIHALGRTIRIQGTNLNTPIRPGSPMRLFEGITRHRVLWVAEQRDAAAGVQLCHVVSVMW